MMVSILTANRSVYPDTTTLKDVEIPTKDIKIPFFKSDIFTKLLFIIIGILFMFLVF